jgi:hypothetical protein
LNIFELKKINFQLKILLFLFMILSSLGAYSPAIAGGDSAGEKIRALKDENCLLEAELGLASQGTSYIILDLRTESDSVPVRINLKNRGIVLREYDAERIRYRRTKGLVIEPIPLIKKMAFFPLKRKEIRPHKPEDGADAIGKLDFLELKDIPSNYTLSFGKGLLISIAGQPKGLISRFIHLIRSTLIHIRYSLAIVWNHFWKNDFAIIEIIMGNEDAQALYWSLNEGMSIVVMERHPYDTI